MSIVSASRRRPALTALTGLLTLALAFLMAMNFNRLPLVGGGDTYRAQFTDASGLQAGEEVRVAGIKVGTVTDVVLEGDHVVVEFQIKGLELGENTTAQIEVKSLLGQHYLSLAPDGPKALPEGYEIPLTRTSTPVNVIPAFQELTRRTARIDSAQVADAFDSLSQMLNSTAPEMRETLRGISRLSHSVASRDSQIRELFAHAKDVSGVVAARDDDLTQLVNSTNSVLEMLNRRRDTIRQIITGTSALSRQLIGLVGDNRGRLRPAIGKLNRVLDVLRANEKEIDQILEYAALYGREFTSVGGSGRWFDATIKLPRGFAACTNGETSAMSALLDPLLSQVNQAVNGSSSPCLPLGPAVDSSGGTP